MTSTVDGRAKPCQAGARCDVPAGAVHSAKMGPNGCRYLIWRSVSMSLRLSEMAAKTLLSG